MAETVTISFDASITLEMLKEEFDRLVEDDMAMSDAEKADAVAHVLDDLGDEFEGVNVDSYTGSAWASWIHHGTLI